MGALSSCTTASDCWADTGDTWLKEQRAWSWVGLFTRCLQHTDCLHWCNCDLWKRPIPRTSSLQVPLCSSHQPSLQHSGSLAFIVSPSAAVPPPLHWLVSLYSRWPILLSFCFCIGDFYMVWGFSRNHLLWWCLLLIISFLFFFFFCLLFSQNKISLWGVYKINNYWGEVRPKGNSLHK